MIPRLLTLSVLGLIGASCSMMVDKNSHDYPQASKDAFMASCVSKSSGQQAACTCLLGKVQEKYSYGEMAELEEKMKGGESPPEFTDFMKNSMRSCVTPGIAPQQ